MFLSFCDAIGVLALVFFLFLFFCFRSLSLSVSFVLFSFGVINNTGLNQAVYTVSLLLSLPLFSVCVCVSVPVTCV